MNETLCDCCDRTTCAVKECTTPTDRLRVAHIRVNNGTPEAPEYAEHDVAFCYRHNR